MTDDIKALFQSKGFFVFLSLMFKLFLDLSYSYAISPLFSHGACEQFKYLQIDRIIRFGCDNVLYDKA